jgi:molybdenum cofactor biosynthesis protein MoaC
MESLFKMIDVGGKRVTRRQAIACGTIHVGAAAFARIRDKTMPKGDVLAMAEVAGIMGAKKTPEIVPMCHPLPLDQVAVDFENDEAKAAITVYCQVAAHAKTGVEMEALQGASAALLSIWDLTKGVEPALEVSGIRLLYKEGGKSGVWVHPEGIPEWLAELMPAPEPLAGIKVAVLVMSDRASKGDYEDKSGPIAREMLEAAGAHVLRMDVVRDDKATITDALAKLTKECRLIICSGGTGVSGTDVTPEALQAIADKPVPGFGELLRQDGASFTRLSWLSRSCAATVGQALVIALPGSPKAVRQGLEVLMPILPHALSMACGGKHEKEST